MVNNNRIKLISRDEFKKGVFKRDNFRCIVCGEKAVDAHHIIERRLFDDGGYYLDNGASLCAKHHMEAEMTTLSCDKLREIIKVKNIILPNDFDKKYKYDKWGNIVLSTGQRVKGELYYDGSVQKILGEGDVLHLFLDYIKYPKTSHLPWSEGVNNNDKMIESLDFFQNEEVIVTVKMDRENTNIYSDYLHGRVLEFKNHPSRDWIKAFHAKLALNIPKGWRICGENLYAKHSIEYKNLRSYFVVFSILNENNECLSWDETKEWCNILGLELVTVLYDGIFDEKINKSIYEKEFKSSSSFNTGIEDVIGETLYFLNGNSGNVTINSVKIGGIDCNISNSYGTGIAELNVSSCLENITISTPEVVIYTDSGVYFEKIFVKGISSNSSDSVDLTFLGIKYLNITYGGGTNNDNAHAIFVDTENNIYVAGESGSPPNIFMIKYNSSGSQILIFTYVSGGARDIFVDNHNNIYLVSDVLGDMLVSKYNSSGSQIWNTTYDGGNGADSSKSIIIDTKENIYVTGESENGLNKNYFTIKYSSLEISLWNDTYDGGELDQSRDIGIDNFNNIYITGTSKTGINGNFYTIKYD